MIHIAYIISETLLTLDSSNKCVITHQSFKFKIYFWTLCLTPIWNVLCRKNTAEYFHQKPGRNQNLNIKQYKKKKYYHVYKIDVYVIY